MIRRSANVPSAYTPMRRPHRKSRNGCKQCKRRHQKCDEHRPACVNCSTANLDCSYLDQLISQQATTVPERESPADSLNLTDSSAPSSSNSLNSLVRALGATGQNNSTFASTDTPASQIFNLDHLVLLHHLDTDMVKAPTLYSASNEEDATKLLETIFKSAVVSPYLMDELLAFSALHLSTLQSDAAEKQRYHNLAQQLQTRALTHFNAARQSVNEENCTPMFLFSSFLGMHLFFDAMNSHHDFTECLDKFVGFLNLHRGVRSITGRSWQFLSQTELRQILGPIEMVDQSQSALPEADNDCDKLLRLLNSDESLSPTSLRACCTAVGSLKWVWNQHGALPKPYPTHVILAWPLLIHPDYIDLLRQRRPEALIILAHWAVLLYDDRDFWLFGNAGLFFIESITRYLGTYWDPWMDGPKRSVNQVDWSHRT